ncbi:hypothetical protein [Aquimarina sp. RZ0]|uniref:hypothetical protein n=1 Tax=Aquimarina sp. RZ0 TaxID=2607730 RepID=UPI0011F3A8FE|nr:hypothetical protein [Aquimarina sp. RZ0]KAA1246561.1 hypothetical protein F0000_07305 [Aquimarina sp. RZ0]
MYSIKYYVSYIYCFLLVFLFVSCKPTLVAQENMEKKNEKPKVEKPKFTGLDSHTPIGEDPNTIRFIGKVVDVVKSQNVCNISRSTAIIKVEKTEGSGSGIVNMINTGQTIILVLNTAFALDIENSKINMEKGIKGSFLIKEGLCQDMAQTIYEMLTFTPVN